MNAFADRLENKAKQSQFQNRKQRFTRQWRVYPPLAGWRTGVVSVKAGKMRGISLVFFDCIWYAPKNWRLGTAASRKCLNSSVKEIL